MSESEVCTIFTFQAFLCLLICGFEWKKSAGHKNQSKSLKYGPVQPYESCLTDSLIDNDQTLVVTRNETFWSCDSKCANEYPKDNGTLGDIADSFYRIR